MAAACSVACALLACDHRTGHHAKALLGEKKVGPSDVAIDEKNNLSFPLGTRIIFPDLFSPASIFGAICSPRTPKRDE